MKTTNPPALLDEFSILMDQTNLEQSIKDPLLQYTKNQIQDSKGLFQSVINIVLTFVGAIIIGVSTLLLIASNSDNLQIEIQILITSIALYFTPALYFKYRKNHLLGNTLFAVSSICAAFSIFESPIYFIIWVSLNLAGLLLSNSRFLCVFLMGLLNIMTFNFLLSMPHSLFPSSQIIQILTLINLLLLVSSHIFKTKFSLLKQFYLINTLNIMSIIGFFFFLFCLTFFKTNTEYEYFAYNILYFILSTGFIIWSFKHNNALHKGVAILSWFAFIFYKYYDVLWKLLHKSLSLFLFGTIFICIGILLHKRSTHDVK